MPSSTRPCRLLAASILALAGSSLAPADIIFVNAAQVLPTAFQSGASWGFAFKSLQDALAEAVPGDQIWVAQGTYKPTSASDRNASFVMKEDVDVIGGFQVGATHITERHAQLFPTILSGEIGGAGDADNSLHVVRATSFDTPTLLAGFTITGGHANVGLADDGGAGVRISNALLSISDCRFVGNKATEFGAGIQITGGAVSGVSVDVMNCIFSGNTATFGGSAVHVQGMSARVIFSTVVGNTSQNGTSGGVTFLNAGTDSRVLSSILRGNVGTGTGLTKNLSITGVTAGAITSNVEGGIAPGTSNYNLDAKFRDADGADDQLGTADDDFTLRGDSPCIDRSAGDAIPGDTFDLDGDGIELEQINFDRVGTTRRIDDPLAANGPIGPAPHPDTGAHEYSRRRTVFVDKDATGANIGTSWADAYTELTSAIQELNDPKFGGDGDIWVAEGTYKPHPSSASVSFIPGSGVHVYGGFIGNGPGGNELDRALRDWQAHPTILSGELGAAGASGNSRNVVRYTGPFVTDTILDGFRISDGAAQSAGGPGGGISISNDASPTIRNCVVANNTAIDGTGGAGIFIGGESTGNAHIVQCAIVANGGSVTGAGAGILVDAEGADITNCVIASNITASSGNAGGVHFTTATSTPTMKNCVLFSNFGGIVSGTNQQVRHVGGGTVQMTCCSIQGFTGPLSGLTTTGCFAFSTDDIVDGNGADNVFGTLDDDFRPTACGALVDAGDNTNLPQDEGDLDHDVIVAEILPIDFGARARRVDMPAANSGIGGGPAIDLGLFELQPIDLPDPDFDNDGDVDAADLAVLLGAWNAIGGEHDLNGDCLVDASDLAVLLGAWTE